MNSCVVALRCISEIYQFAYRKLRCVTFAGIPSLRFPRTPLPLTGLLPWKTLPEMVMLSTTLGTLTSVSQVALNGSFCVAKIFTKDFPTVPGPLWVWIPPMSTYIRVLCYLLNCRRGTLKMYSALRLKGLNTTTLTLVQPKAFKQHFARWEHSLSNSPDDSQVITENMITRLGAVAFTVL